MTTAITVLRGVLRSATALGLILLGSAGLSAAVHGRGGSERFVRILWPAEDSVELQWSAKIFASGGWFRIYRGADLWSLEVISQQDAAVGISHFDFRDRPTGSEPTLYQVRYAGPNGNEMVLAVLLVEPTRLQPVCAAPISAVKLLMPPRAPAPIDLPAVAKSFEPTPTLAPQFMVQPPVPPPRAILL